MDMYPYGTLRERVKAKLNMLMKNFKIHFSVIIEKSRRFRVIVKIVVYDEDDSGIICCRKLLCLMDLVRDGRFKIYKPFIPYDKQYSDFVKVSTW